MQAVNSNSTDNCQQQINHKREGFDCIDRNFWEDPNLSGNDCKVAGWMNSHKLKFNPSLAKISEKLNMSQNTAKKCLDNLVNNGYFLKTQTMTKYGPKNVYISTRKIYGSEDSSQNVPPSKIDMPTPSKIDTQRNSTKGKAYIINDDIFYEPHEPDIPEPSSLDSNVLVDEFEKHEVDGETLTLYELKTRIGNRTHGTNYDWPESNKNFKGWILKHGAQTVWDVAKALIKSVQGRTIKHDKKFVRAMNMKLQEVVCE